jgi:hypothetical protein
LAEAPRLLRFFSGIVVLAVLAALLARRLRRDKERRGGERLRFFSRAIPLLEDTRFEETGSVGYPRLCGRYRNFHIQVYPVIDTLPVRRLPALWLLVTLQDALPIKARLDLVMRPNGPTTFSNFDSLPHTLAWQAGLPHDAVIRTDDPAHVMPMSVIARHTDIFEDPRAKELLITPTGVRLVWLIEEAGRAQYGVFRQADFGVADIDPTVLGSLLDRLVAIRTSVLEWAKARA